MKKVLLSALFVGGMFTLSAFAQEGNVEAIAKKALRDAGCLDNGSYTASIESEGTCTTNLGEILPYYVVVVYPNPNNNSKIAYKLGPVGRVSICGTDVVVTECL